MSALSVIYEWATHNGALAVAGGFGGAVRWLANFRTTHFIDGVSGIIVGGVVAHYAPPLILPWFSKFFLDGKVIDPGDYSSAGFLIGMVALNIVSYMLRRANKLTDEADKDVSDK